MKKFILGILIGGLLLSGGWFAWGAIQSQVGINGRTTSGAWLPIAIDTSGNLNITPTGSTTPTDAFANPTTSQTVFALCGEFNGTTWDRCRNSFTQSTTNITTNAAGTTITLTTTPPNTYTMIVDRTAGSTDAVEIDLQCSINNTAFVQIATITSLVSEPTLTAIGDIPCNYMRYNVVTVGSGNTISIDILATR